MDNGDSKHWLLLNIRNSVISTGDSEMCENIKPSENFPKLFLSESAEVQRRVRFMNSMKGDDGLDSKRYAANFDHHHTSSKANGENIDEKKKFVCHDNIATLSTSTMSEHEQEVPDVLKTVSEKADKQGNNGESGTVDPENLFNTEKTEPLPREKTVLTEQLGKRVYLNHCQYLVYAKYDSSGQREIKNKSYKIFMTMAPENVQNYPVPVTIVASATIQDLIGLVCYQFSLQYPEINLGSPFKYGLCIADDDGDIDWTFPCFGPNQKCSQISFDYLGLVDLDRKKELAGEPAEFTCHDDFEDFSQPFHGNNSGSQETLNAVQAAGQRRTLNFDTLYMSCLPSNSCDPQVYAVRMCHSFKLDTKVNLRVSLDRIEVEPILGRWRRLFTTSRYFIHTMDTIACCEVLYTFRTKSTFRVTYNRCKWPSDNVDVGMCFQTESDLKHHVFRCHSEYAKQITAKINRFMEIRNSPCYRDYKHAQEKKRQAKENKSCNSGALLKRR